MGAALTHPQYFTHLAPDGRLCRGNSESWYPHPWQQRMGSAPAAAAVLLYYLAKTRPSLAPLTGDIGEGMRALWPYLLPSAQGVVKGEHFLLGCRSFALSKGCHLRGELLDIPGRGWGRPGVEIMAGFLQTAFSANWPVAFLDNLAGAPPREKPFYWAPLIAAQWDGGTLSCRILTQGEERTLNLTQWWKTTHQGGSLVAVGPWEEGDLFFTPQTE